MSVTTQGIGILQTLYSPNTANSLNKLYTQLHTQNSVIFQEEYICEYAHQVGLDISEIHCIVYWVCYANTNR